MRLVMPESLVWSCHICGCECLDTGSFCDLVGGGVRVAAAGLLWYFCSTATVNTSTAGYSNATTHVVETSAQHCTARPIWCGNRSTIPVYKKFQGSIRLHVESMTIYLNWSVRSRSQQRGCTSANHGFNLCCDENLQASGISVVLFLHAGLMNRRPVVLNMSICLQCCPAALPR